MSKNGNRYNAEFRKRAIAHSQQQGNTIAETAKHFDISDQTLRNWIKKSGAQNRQGVERMKIKQLETELAEIKRHMADLELANEILIKATAIFAASKQK